MAFTLDPGIMRAVAPALGTGLQDLGYGLASAPTIGTAFGAMAKRASEQQPQRDIIAIQQREAADKQAAMEEQSKLRAKYAEMFATWGEPLVAQGIADGTIDYREAYWDKVKPKTAATATEAPASVREYEYYTSLTPEQKGEYIRMKRANPYLDIGTGFVQPDPINPGQTSGAPILKDNYTPGFDNAFGTNDGKVASENKAAYEDLAAKMPGLQTVVDQLGALAEKATYTQTGQLWDAIVRETGEMPSEAAIARTSYISMIDQEVLPLLKQTFGGAFTVEEGKALKATLGDPNLSPVEKKAVLQNFIARKHREVAEKAARAGITTEQGGPANDPLGIRR